MWAGSDLGQLCGVGQYLGAEQIAQAEHVRGRRLARGLRCHRARRRRRRRAPPQRRELRAPPQRCERRERARRRGSHGGERLDGLGGRDVPGAVSSRRVCEQVAEAARECRPCQHGWSRRATYPEGRASFISRPQSSMPLKSCSAVAASASVENSTKANLPLGSQRASRTCVVQYMPRAQHTRGTGWWPRARGVAARRP